MPRSLPGLETLLEQLVAVPSVSSSDAALDMSNGPIAEMIGEWLRDAGFTVDILDIAGHPGKVNLLATLAPAGGGSGGGLVLAGHLDTVPAGAGWREDPFRLRQEGDRYVGLGTSDMKGFIALAIHVAAQVERRALREPLILLGTADEESSMCGGKALVAAGRPRARHAVIGEPTGLKPVRAHKGILFDAIRVIGKAGHSSNPGLGRNALEGMHRVMSALMAFREGLARDWHSDVFEVAQPTLNFGCLHGGDAPNRVCAEARLEIDLRTLPGMNLQDFRVQLRRHAVDALDGTDFAVEFETLFEGIDALETPADAPLVRALEQMTGETASAVAFATEGPYLRELGMDVVVCGPGDIDQAHRPGESLSIAALQRSGEQLATLIRKFCL